MWDPFSHPPSDASPLQNQWCIGASTAQKSVREVRNSLLLLFIFFSSFIFSAKNNKDTTLHMPSVAWSRVNYQHHSSPSGVSSCHLWGEEAEAEIAKRIAASHIAIKWWIPLAPRPELSPHCHPASSKSFASILCAPFILCTPSCHSVVLHSHARLSLLQREHRVAETG